MMLPADFLYREAACGLILTELDGTVISANETFLGWLGRDAAEIEGAIRFQNLLRTGARIFHQTHWLPLLQIQGWVAEVKLDFSHASGNTVPMVVNARAVTLPDGRACHSIATYVASDRDAYERELLQARAEAEESLAERTRLQAEVDERSRFAEQLIGIVSHDLRNPLTAIRMGADMLVLDETDPKRLKMASRINESVNRALSLVQDLLDFTLTKTGRALSLDRSSIDVHQVVANGIDELRWAFPKATLEHEAKGPGAIEADAEKLTRVLGNLVANAVRYGDGEQPVRVRSTVEAGRVHIEVCNSGTPIPAELLATIFEPMTRGPSHHGGGVGLGLYIVSQIASAHGGHPTASSTLETGTRMGIEFPARADASSAAHLSRSAPFSH